jgi:hypothetical protein
MLGMRNGVVKTTFELLAQDSKFHEAGLARIIVNFNTKKKLPQRKASLIK